MNDRRYPHHERLRHNLILPKHPITPPPQPKEEVVEQLVQRPPVDTRPKLLKPVEFLPMPHFNRMYGTLRHDDGWRYVIDNYASGTVTTVANATTTVAVKLTLDPHWRLEQWPGGTQVFLAIRQFSIAPQTATFATPGAIDVLYQDTIGGQIIPLGDFVSSQGYTIFLQSLIPTPLTDPDVQNVGNLLFALNTGATPGTYNWQMGFSGAYMLPALPEGHNNVNMARHRS